MKTLSIDSSISEYHLEIGDLLTFKFREHISVGFTADFEIEDESVLKHKETVTEYQNPERMKIEGISGADAASTVFVFSAFAEGTTLLLIRNIYRMELESEYRFRIHVI